MDANWVVAVVSGRAHRAMEWAERSLKFGSEQVARIASNQKLPVHEHSALGRATTSPRNVLVCVGTDTRNTRSFRPKIIVQRLFDPASRWASSIHVPR
jgi:hypothetical protein